MRNSEPNLSGAIVACAVINAAMWIVIAHIGFHAAVAVARTIWG